MSNPVKTIVLYSMGICSAYIACRLQDECQKPICIFNDTGQEDADTYRFGREVQARWGLEVVDVSAGETLFEWFRRNNMIPARQYPACSIALKIKPTQAYLETFPGPARVAYGYDVDEPERFERTQARWAFPNLTPYAPLQEWGVSKEQCFGYFADHGIAPPRVYRHTQHANCFSGDTRFITSEGIKTLKECAGNPVRVIGKGGKWTDAEVHSFGEQPLRRITFSRYGETKQVLATGGHRWFTFRSGWFREKGTYDEVVTDDLKINSRMASMFGTSVNFPPSPFGIAAGIVFGDGSVCTYQTEEREHWNPSARLTLCGDKDRQLLKWFPNCPVHDVPNIGVSVSGLPRFFKSAPPLKESKPYLYGWLAGYFAADGCMDQNGKAVLASATLGHLELARDVAALLGFPTLAIRKVMRKGFGEEATALYSLPFPVGSLPNAFFLIDSHHARNKPRETYMHDWRVVSVEETDSAEEVYCAVVPDGNAFTLDGNLFTGNCFPCKNWSKRDWQTARHFYPEVYAESQAFEEETGLRFMQDGPRLIDLPMLDAAPTRKGRKALAGDSPAFSFDSGCDACRRD